jgi:hypothetical protein
VYPKNSKGEIAGGYTGSFSWPCYTKNEPDVGEPDGRRCRPAASAPLKSQPIHLSISLCLPRLPPCAFLTKKRARCLAYSESKGSRVLWFVGTRVCRNSLQEKRPHSLGFFSFVRPKTSSMSENQTEMPAGGKRPAADPADAAPPSHLPPSPALSILPHVLKIFVRNANFAVESNYGFCEAHRVLIHRTASTKKQRTTREPPTGSVPGVKPRPCHLCKLKKGPKCKDGCICIAHASRKQDCRACSPHNYCECIGKNRERPYVDKTA